MDYSYKPIVLSFETLIVGLFPILIFVFTSVRHTIGILLVLITSRPVMKRRKLPVSYFLLRVYISFLSNRIQ